MLRYLCLAQSSWGGRRHAPSLISERHLGETASEHICLRQGDARLLRPDMEVSKMRHMAYWELLLV